MISGIYPSLSGITASFRRLAVNANNIANLNTAGYKKSRIILQDSPDNLGVTVSKIEKVFSPGSIESTNNPLHVGIDGEGFFQVKLPDGGLAYTRDGSFSLDHRGMMVNPAGHLLHPPVNISRESTSVSISPDGAIVAVVDGAPEVIGQIELSSFSDPGSLLAIGGNLFQPTGKSGNLIPGTPGTNKLGTLITTGLESSNVDLPEEMVNLIISQRSLEANIRAFQTEVDMTGTILDIKE